jgi:hypothetical protein
MAVGGLFTNDYCIHHASLTCHAATVVGFGSGCGCHSVTNCLSILELPIGYHRSPLRSRDVRHFYYDTKRIDRENVWTISREQGF